MTTEQTQQCNKCKETKNLSDFPKDKTRGIGYRGECKACRSARRKEVGGEYQIERMRKHYYRSGGEGTLTLEQLAQIESQKYCTYCDCELNDDIRMVDHVFSLGQWWSINSAINMFACCRSCNSSKNNAHVYDFYQRSAKFTPELWERFVSNFLERLIKRKPTGEEIEQWKQGFELEAKELKENKQRA